MSSPSLNTAFGFGIGLVASEHIFSSLLTSPVTAKRFFRDDEEGKEDIRKALTLAIGLSVIAAIILSILLDDWTALITVAVICAFYWWEFNRALEGII